MGGLFKAPKPVVVSTPAQTAQESANIASQAQTDAAAAASKARQENMARVQRGLAGTIATSARGVLDAGAVPYVPRKTLLGE